MTGQGSGNTDNERGTRRNSHIESEGSVEIRAGEFFLFTDVGAVHPPS